MQSAAPPPVSLFSTTPSPLREVQVLYRRICVLRVSGKNAEAEKLNTEKLTIAIAAARESDAVTQQQLDAVFAVEEDRVDSAHALAEILLPLLTADGARSRAEVIAQRSGAASLAPLSPSSSSELLPASGAGAGPGPLPGIADFIDAMLTQERTPSVPTPKRRSA